MEIRQLKYFVAVVDNGSLSRAALQVFVAQSALSKQIAELEDELGERLLHRSRSGVMMTEAGKIFYSYANAILKQLSDVKAAVRSNADAVEGEVVVGVPHSVAAVLALPLMRAAAERLPGLSLHLNEELAGNMVDQLHQGRTDLMVFTKIEDEDIEFRPFAEEEFYLLSGSEGLPGVAAGEDVSATTVAQLQLTLPGLRHGQCTREWLAAAFEKSGLLLNVVNEINSANILKSAVEAGMATTVMPYSLAGHEIAAGRIVAHRIRPERVVRTIGVCYSSHVPVTNAKRAVRNLVFSVSRQLCTTGKWVGGAYTGP